MKTTRSRRKLLGIYDLGAETIEVYVRDGTGAEFCTWSGPKGERHIASIVVGMDYSEFYRVVVNLMHEAKEMSDMRMGCRLCPDIDYARDSGGYVFMETHAQHGEVCARVGYLLTECWSDLSRAWNKWKKETKK